MRSNKQINYYFVALNILSNINYMLESYKTINKNEIEPIFNLYTENNFDTLQKQMDSLKKELINEDSKLLINTLVNSLGYLSSALTKIIEINKESLLKHTQHSIALFTLLKDTINEENNIKQLYDLIGFYIYNNPELLTIYDKKEGIEQPIPKSKIRTDINIRPKTEMNTKLKETFFNTNTDFLISISSNPILKDLDKFVKINYPEQSFDINNFTHFINKNKEKILNYYVKNSYDRLNTFIIDLNLINLLEFLYENSIAYPKVFKVNNFDHIVYTSKIVDYKNLIYYVLDYLGENNLIEDINNIINLLTQNPNNKFEMTAFDIKESIEGINEIDYKHKVIQTSSDSFKIHTENIFLDEISEDFSNGDTIHINKALAISIYDFVKTFSGKYAILNQLVEKLPDDINKLNAEQITMLLNDFVDIVLSSNITLHMYYTNDFLTSFITKLNEDMNNTKSGLTINHLSDILSKNLINHFIFIANYLEQKYAIDQIPLGFKNTFLKNINQLDNIMAEKYTKRVLNDTKNQINQSNIIGDVKPNDEPRGD
ncbi:hypothetical protein DEFDS_P266 (plasmid) [Deferribacter desulfuricans SSM1]|uniref:Uncharacterized protein n=1 Tax=Deferribacter desulfuricans (strain DSM 14783 / JCM 11476 / NBRC 101012 / SSM1) TaxID=639282 RepID=D3PF94_DEFDS|nr:hypothetical protein [Deferribacter desulfuricans]BAI81886.1 hypothetical protein DEFDS_P266 [Deferribacter desulfuricans SSM1]